MSPCSCAPAALTTLSFDNGTVLLRCHLHEQQRWLVDGEPAATPEALSGLRALFIERRGTDRRAYTPRDTIRLDRTSPPAAPAAAPLDDQLTALLHSRGLQGSWAVA